MVVKCRYYDRKERQEQPESIVPFPRCSQGLAKPYPRCRLQCSSHVFRIASRRHTLKERTPHFSPLGKRGLVEIKIIGK